MSLKAVPDKKQAAAVKDQPGAAPNDQPENLRKELLELNGNVDDRRAEMKADLKEIGE